MEAIKHSLIEFFKEVSEKPLSLRELSRRLGVPKEKRESFKKLVKELIRDGTIVKISGGRVGIPSKMNLVRGELSSHPDGFGFVIPENGTEDVYISPTRLKGAMHGDKVIARIEGRKEGRKFSGSIIRILERAHKKIVGRFQKTPSGGMIIPSDEKLLHNVMIPRMEIHGVKEGNIVEAEIIRWPSRFDPPLGRIVEILGHPEEPRVEIEMIAKKYDLPRRFPHEVMREANDVPTVVAPSELRQRRNLTGLRIFTIDGETARDFDDAVAIEKTKNGYKLFVSVADVSHYVKEGSAIDHEAYLRGTSVYFPGHCIPMLPEKLSNGISSLNPGEMRLAVTAELDFDPHGNLVKKDFYESVIKSMERLTYTNAKKLITGEDRFLSQRYSHILDELKTMEELALKLYAMRMEKGSIDFDLPEPEIIIDIEGRPQDIVKSERNIAHRIIEEFMLSANRAVADIFAVKNEPFIFRVHKGPDEESIEDLREFIKGFGYHLPERTTPKAFQKLLSSAQTRPEEKLINHLLLRSMKQAVYSEENSGHFGLAFENYTHFTSPIRRYPDLVVHRLLKTIIAKKHVKDVSALTETLRKVSLHSSQRERNAMEAEREIVNLKKVQFMKDRVKEVFAGFITGVASFGFFVELKDFFVEGLVHVTTLQDDYYVYAEKKHALIGENTKRRFQLGMAVTARIVKVDLERRRIDMELWEPSMKKRYKRK